MDETRPLICAFDLAIAKMTNVDVGGTLKPFAFSSDRIITNSLELTLIFLSLHKYNCLKKVEGRSFNALLHSAQHSIYSIICTIVYIEIVNHFGV